MLIPHNVAAQIAPTNSATISGSVSDSTGKPVAHAKVSVSGPKNASTQSDARGFFVFIGMSFGSYELTADASGLGTATRNLIVEGDTNVAIEYNTTIVNGLKVIAQVKNIAPAQFNVTSASITQVNPMEEAFQGETSWRRILEQIPGVAQAGLLGGQSQVAGVPDSPLVPVQLSIDGALPYETATLLDGMPLIGGSYNYTAGNGTDLGRYALNGFDAADVVRGPGANAPSIVDSIGGSFVLHSPSVVSKNHFEFSVSNDPYGGIVANALIGVRFTRLSVVATYGINSSPGPLSSAGIQGPPDPILTVNGQSFSPYSPPCSSPCYSGQYLLNTNYTLSQFPYYGYQLGILEGGLNQTTSWNQHSGSIALSYEFSPSISVGFFYAGLTSSQNGAPTSFTNTFVPPAGYGESLPAGQYISNTSYLSDYPFTQTSSLLEEKVTARLGNGVLRLAALQNRIFEECSFSEPASAVVRLYGGGYLNGSSTLTIFNGEAYTITLSPFSVITPEENSNNRDLLISYATPIGEKFHVGASFVKSYYDTPQSYSIPFYGIFSTTPSAVSETTNETRFFIGGDPSEKTSLDLSMYFANANYHVPTVSGTNATLYHDANYPYVAPRLGFVWRPTASVAVRAAAGGGFAEAPLNYIAGGVSAPQPCLSSPGYCENTANLNLQPEKSFGFELGTDIRLPRDTVLSFDVYRSDLYGQFYNATTVSAYTIGGVTYPLYTTQYGNLGKSRYEGLLIDLHHDVPRGLYWTFSGGLTRGYLVSVPQSFYNSPGQTCDLVTGVGCTNVNVMPNINFNGTFTGVSVPYAQALGVLGYRWDIRKSVDITGVYFGNNNTYFHPGFVEFDGHIHYPLTKILSLSATFRNITGIYDRAMQIYSPASGAPTITGLPYPLYGEQYGPRTVLMTLNLKQ